MDKGAIILLIILALLPIFWYAMDWPCLIGCG